jgi:uncharacterized Tic20 family protein
MSTPSENPYANPASHAGPLSPSEEKQWAILDHVVSIFFPFVASLIFYVIYKDRGPFIRAHVVTEWNLQLTQLIFTVIGFVLSFGSVFLSFIPMSAGSTGPGPGFGFFFVGYFLILGIRLAATIFGIIAAVAANKGRFYKYSLAIPFVKA